MPFNVGAAVKFCGIKHTVNGDGSRGAYGDAKFIGCVVDKFAEHVANEAGKSGK